MKIESLSLVIFFSSRIRHTRFGCDWSSDVCSSDLRGRVGPGHRLGRGGNSRAPQGGARRGEGRCRAGRVPLSLRNSHGQGRPGGPARPGRPGEARRVSREPHVTAIDDLQWDSQGLIPALAQEAETGELLMLAWMDRQALTRTLETGLAHYWSRSRQALWQKGETSGHRQRGEASYADCDRGAA